MALSAVEPGLMGPVIICGSLMSHWAGVDGKNPDALHGRPAGRRGLLFTVRSRRRKFDGANLVANFERLNRRTRFLDQAL